MVKQKVEKFEVFAGYECANRYQFFDPHTGIEIGGADESSGGVGSFLSRAFLGPARPLNIDVTDPSQGVWMEARRPFSFLGFVRPPTMAVHSNEGLLGTVTGMIASFNVLGMSKGAARPDELAVGIRPGAGDDSLQIGCLERLQ